MSERAGLPAFARRPPAPALQPFIDGYVGYRLDGMPGAVHRGLPSRYLTMIVSIGEPIDVLAHTDPYQAPGAYGFVLSGLQVSPALIAADGPQEGVTIELTPLGARSLLGWPAAELWDTTVEADAVLGPVATRLRDQLHEAASWSARFAACDRVLSALLDERAAVPRQLEGAWRLLVGSGGTTSVSALAGAVGWSRRHLAERFAGEFGCSPKAAAKVIRFERACALLRGPDRPRLADVAQLAGYYDQPHLNRDFIALAGCSPAAWLAAELPFVQDPDGPVPAGFPA